MADGPAFYFDLGSPDAYLLAERVLPAMPVATEWIPVLAAGLPGAESFEAFRCAEERSIVLGEFVEMAARPGSSRCAGPSRSRSTRLSRCTRRPTRGRSGAPSRSR